jgi:ParB/RepB/Spo0J family partition protein
MTPDKTPTILVSIPLIDCDDPNNGRLEFDPQAAAEFAAGIAAIGLLHPITVTPRGERFALVAGGRRLAACRQLAWAHIPCVVKELNAAQVAEIRLLENAERKQISPVEEAAQLSDYIKTTDAPLSQVARRLNRSVEWVKLRLAIIEWPPALVQHVHAGRISLAAARYLAQITDPASLATAVDTAARSGVTAALAREWLRDAQVHFPPENGASQNAGQSVSGTYESMTTVDCFSCKTRVELSDTLSVRMCHHCLQAIAEIPPNPGKTEPPSERELNRLLGPE